MVRSSALESLEEEALQVARQSPGSEATYRDQRPRLLISCFNASPVWTVAIVQPAPRVVELRVRGIVIAVSVDPWVRTVWTSPAG